MKKKIKYDDIVRLVYEQYKRIINEDVSAYYIRADIPVQINPVYQRGNFFVYMNIFAIDKIATFGNYKKNMLGYFKNINSEKSPKDIQEDFNRRFWTGTKTIGGKKCIVVRILIENPMDVWIEKTEDVNWKSTEVGHVAASILWLAKGFNIPASELKDEIQYTFKRIYYLAKNLYTKEVEEELNKQEASFFFDICRKIGEPETLKMFNEIKIYKGDEIVDHQFWPGNVIRIMTQAAKYGKTPTYLATYLQWKKMGRKVVNFNYPYRGVTFDGGRVPTPEIVRRLAKHGKSMASMMEAYNAQTHRAGEVEVNSENGIYKFSVNSPYYDVEDTIVDVIDGWTNGHGYKNNLTGELNDYSKKHLHISTEDDEKKANRIKKINKALGTEDYSGVNVTYEAICNVAKVKTNNRLTATASIEDKIEACNRMISEMLTKCLNDFSNKDGGNIALEKNISGLVDIGMVIIKRFIGLPMNGAPSIPDLTTDMTNVLSTHVKKIANKIIAQKLKIVNNEQSEPTINEMIEHYSSLFVFEETFNNTIKILKEYVEK